MNKIILTTTITLSAYLVFFFVFFFSCSCLCFSLSLSLSGSKKSPIHSFISFHVPSTKQTLSLSLSSFFFLKTLSFSPIKKLITRSLSPEKIFTNSYKNQSSAAPSFFSITRNVTATCADITTALLLVRKAFKVTWSRNWQKLITPNHHSHGLNIWSSFCARPE